MNGYFYKDTISNFLTDDPERIIGKMSSLSRFSDELTQKNAWKEEISILKNVLQDIDGTIYFEFSIPRMGSRVDTILLINQQFLF
jgi:hypothetical protein